MNTQSSNFPRHFVLISTLHWCTFPLSYQIMPLCLFIFTEFDYITGIMWYGLVDTPRALSSAMWCLTCSRNAYIDTNYGHRYRVLLYLSFEHLFSRILHMHVDLLRVEIRIHLLHYTPWHVIISELQSLYWKYEILNIHENDHTLSKIHSEKLVLYIKSHKKLIALTFLPYGGWTSGWTILQTFS